MEGERGGDWRCAGPTLGTQWWCMNVDLVSGYTAYYNLLIHSHTHTHWHVAIDTLTLTVGRWGYSQGVETPHNIVWDHLFIQ